MIDDRVVRRPVEDFLSVAGPMVVINLPYRKDRRRQFARQLERVDLSFDHPSVRLYPAVRPAEAAGFPTIGTRGCFLSHMGVLREALTGGLQSVLICEDDLDFTPDMISRIHTLTVELERQPWNLFYGGYSDPPRGEIIAPGLVRADPQEGIVCAHFYAVRGPAIADLIGYLEAILTRPPGDPAGGPMHVDGAISRFRADHPQYVTLVAVPPLGDQRSSRTDIHALRWFDRWPIVRGIVAVLRSLR